MPHEPRPVLWLCLLVALTVIAYVPALDAGFVFDDTAYLTTNDRMASVEGLGQIWGTPAGEEYRHQYYPLTSSAFWVQRRLWGDHPVGYHLVNVLLHATNAILLWRLLVLLGVRGAWVAGAIFAVHPVHVQSVAWVSELKNVLSGFFFLASMIVFVRFFDERTRGRYALALALFVCALLSKTATCLLPLALLLVLWWKHGRVTRRELVWVAPPAVLGLAFVGLTVFLESHYGGAQGSSFDQGLVERGLVAGRALWFYAAKLAWPLSLIFIYPRWEIDAASWWQYLFPLAAIATLATLWVLRDRIGRGPFAGVAYFVLALAPLSFVNVAFTRLSWVADHWQYWASMGLIALAIGVASKYGRVWQRPAAVAAIVALMAITWNRCLVYESNETLWTDTLARNPQAWVAHYNLGVLHSKSDRHDEAIHHYRETIRLKPDYVWAHNNLGIDLHLRGQSDAALVHLEESVRLSPQFALGHAALGSLLVEIGQTLEGIDHLRRAAKLAPDNAEIGRALAQATGAAAAGAD